MTQQEADRKVLALIDDLIADVSDDPDTKTESNARSAKQHASQHVLELLRRTELYRNQVRAELIEIKQTLAQLRDRA